MLPVLLVIAAAALLVIAVLVVRHWKEIRLLDPESIREERERQKREELLLHRFERLTADGAAPIKAVANAVVIGVKKWYHAILIHLVKLEKYYTQAKTPFAFMNTEAQDRVNLLLDDARALARDQRFADAERRFLEVLAIDQRNMEAYKGLGSIYLKQKLYPQARETFEFLLRSKHADDVVFASLADIAAAEGDAARVEEMRRRAVEARPRMAVRHAELAEMYLERGEAAKAAPFIRRATDLDPKSSRYLELSIETAILLGDRNDARRRYDTFRLLSEDRAKIQAMKEKIDALGQ